MAKILTKNLRAFVRSLSQAEKADFRNLFMKQTGISYPTWYNYSSGRTPILSLMASEKALNLAKELHPEFLHILLEENNEIEVTEA